MYCIELNEIGIGGMSFTPENQGKAVRWGDGGYTSPGIGSHDRDQLYLGNEARTFVKIAPNDAFTGFWQCLDKPDAPVSKSLPDITIRYAASSHLESLLETLDIEDKRVTVAIPSNLSDFGIQGVKGIFSDLRLHEVEVIDAALAAYLANQKKIPSSMQECLYIDITFEEAYVTVLSRNEKYLEVAHVHSEEGLGFSVAEEIILDAADNIFFQHTKVRPSRKGETEQKLYEQIHNWLFTGEEEHQFNVAGRKVTIKVQEIAEALKNYADKLVHFTLGQLKLLNQSGQQRPVLLSQQISMLPGINKQLARLPGVTLLQCEGGGTVCHGAKLWREILESQAVHNASSKSLELIEGGQSGEVEHGAGNAETIASTENALCFHTGVGGFLDSGSVKVTHLLFQGRCLPLNNETFRIGRDIPDNEPGLRIVHDLPEVSSFHCELRKRPDGFMELTGLGEGEVYHNDRPADIGTPLKVGDYLGIGGHKVELMFLSLLQSE